MENEKPKYSPLNPLESGEEKPNFILTLWRRYFYYFIILEVALVLGFGYWFLLKPKIKIIYQSQGEKNAAYQKNEQELAALDKQIGELSKIKQNYDSLGSENEAKVNEMLPQTSGQRDLAMQINKMAAANGLLLKSIDFGEKETAGQEIAPAQTLAKEVEINFEVMGVTYPALKSLLNSLENNLRLIDVSAVKYSPKGETAELTVKSYYLSDDINADQAGAKTTEAAAPDELDFFAAGKFTNLRSNAEIIEIKEVGNKNPFANGN
ncbi:MAG: hypothetical protein M0Q92_00545 [Methanoregula sp.]|jgi:Tfp pilus assembly protein PilO|nr:hypothetical protein [Methanoregula sp.]